MFTLFESIHSFLEVLFYLLGGIFMYFDMRNGINVESKNLIDKIGNDHIGHYSFCPSCNAPQLLNNVGQKPDPLCLVSPPSITSERIDDIPLLLSTLLRLDLPKIIDMYYTPHTNHQGLSYGWLLTIWLVYILSQSDHRMSHVQDWVASRWLTLTKATGQTVTEQDFTDDRLARVLEMLSDDTLWQQIEEHLSGHTIRAYNLELKRIRLDATTASTNHDPEKSSLISVGRTKQNLFEPQFKLMIGTLDPLGLPIATDLVSGEKADDPLYVPIYKRIDSILGTKGIIYIGDCKMGAIETRGIIDKDGNFYLIPLPMTGETPVLLDKVLSELDAGAHTLTHIFLPEDEERFKELKMDPDPKLAIAIGFEIIVERKTTLDGEEVIWNERVYCVQSLRHAASQSIALDNRIARAEKDLQNLTPPSGRGKKVYQDETELKNAADKIVQHHKVEGLIEYTLERQESHKDIRAYGGNPARTETTVRCQIDTITKNDEAIEQTRKRLGWRLYVTNAPLAALSLSEAVLVYRDQYIVENDFSRLKGYLGITPMYVQKDDHICGLIRLLTLALRAMCVIEFAAKQTLLKDQDVLRGIYPGNPARSTASPSVELMLKAFNGLDLFVTNFPNGQHFEQISPLNEVQKKILYLLGIPESVYNDIPGKTQYALQMGITGSGKPSLSAPGKFCAGRKSGG